MYWTLNGGPVIERTVRHIPLYRCCAIRSAQPNNCDVLQILIYTFIAICSYLPSSLPHAFQLPYHGTGGLYYPFKQHYSAAPCILRFLTPAAPPHTPLCITILHTTPGTPG